MNTLFNDDFIMDSQKILIIGDVMIDRYIIGKVTRISPEAPVPVVNVNTVENCLGGSNNVANNVAKLGLQSYSFGVVGYDNDAVLMKELMRKSKIIDKLCHLDEAQTITKVRIIGEKQQIVRLDYEKKVHPSDSIWLSLLEILTCNNFDIIIISDYNKGVCSELICQNVLKFANQMKIPVIVDPKGNDWKKYIGAYLITPNLKELEEIVGYKITNDDLEVEYAGKSILGQYKINNLLVTRSEQGMTLITNDTIKHFKTQAKEVYDVSGAGDTVIAVLAVCLTEDMSVENCILHANKAAGYVISKFGTYAISRQELNSL